MANKVSLLVFFIVFIFQSNAAQIATTWAGGDGSMENPYQISDISHLKKLANDVNRGISFIFHSIKNAKISNIVFDDCYLFGIVRQSYGNTVINNCINLGSTYTGLISNTKGAIILSNCGNFGKFGGSGLAGDLPYGTMVNCYNYGGGIKDTHTFSGLVCSIQNCENCLNKGALYGKSGIGGLVWKLQLAVQNSVFLESRTRSPYQRIGK